MNPAVNTSRPSRTDCEKYEMMNDSAYLHVRGVSHCLVDNKAAGGGHTVRTTKKVCECFSTRYCECGSWSAVSFRTLHVKETPRADARWHPRGP